VVVDASDRRLGAFAAQHAKVGLFLEDQRLRRSRLVAVDEFNVARRGRAVGVDVERYRVRRDQHRLVAFILGRHLDSDVLGQYADTGRLVVLESRSRGIEAATLNADTLSEARLALSSVSYGDAFRRRQLDVSSQYREGRNGGGDAGRFGVLVDDRA